MNVVCMVQSFISLYLTWTWRCPLGFNVNMLGFVFWNWLQQIFRGNTVSFCFGSPVLANIVTNTHISTKCFYQCSKHHCEVFLMMCCSRSVKSGILLCAETATIVLCLFGKIADQPWASVLLPEIWTVFRWENFITASYSWTLFPDNVYTFSITYV